MIREELPLGGGIYALWAHDRCSVYVGQTNNLRARCKEHLPSILLGNDFEVGMLLDGASRKEREAVEDRIILALRARGLRVVNMTNAELYAKNTAAMNDAPLETRQQRGRVSIEKMRSKMTPEKRDAAQKARSEGNRRFWAGLSLEERRQHLSKARAARWPK